MGGCIMLGRRGCMIWALGSREVRWSFLSRGAADGKTIADFGSWFPVGIRAKGSYEG